MFKLLGVGPKVSTSLISSLSKSPSWRWEAISSLTYRKRSAPCGLNFHTMSVVDLGRLQDLRHTRHSITLSNGKRLVLFRLPRIDRPDVTLPAVESPDSWNYYAMEAECPHAGGPMADAHIDIEDSSYIASCPWHAYDFNVETGESSYGIKACTFPVTVQDERVSIQVAGTANLQLDKIEPVSEKVKFKHGPRTDPSGPATYLGEDASLCDWCNHILNTSNPEHKIELTTHLFSLFATREQSSSLMEIGAGTVIPPQEPPRQNLTQLKPGQMPRAGKGGNLKNRIMMLHALANIEQWAIDLAIDIMVRFASFQTAIRDENDRPRPLPRTFFYDWLKVANDEAKHFSLLRARLEEMGSHFGALPVHHGLWESAVRTSHDLRARISVIALVHEARGLDVNPKTIEKFQNAKDSESVDALNIIHNDEITHVTTGHRWLTWICQQEGTDPVQVFRSNVQQHFRGAVRGPFNAEARQQAGMDKSYYEDLQGLPWKGDIIAGG
ncbi:Rieske [2Fe-2S] domain protein [Daldinia vernicosa]|uniref:Rieske [2Fe-2S] domain protein n=1 Tax=Daldinia vernicosa TaxID=114800 RepID=UPI0020078430|nr:Rieske [2Fe-2S] domain protein [Daldinia vernicosa]KAI0848769.1 Rieske [2Fe-2S] domain protein [Daldinia vernicosa]